MDKDRARQISNATREASRLLEESVAWVRDRCSEQAAGVYRSAVGRVMGEMAAGLQFPLWREHPSLEPESMKGPGTYDARQFEMPTEVADGALATLAKAKELLQQVATLLEGEPTLSERQAYSKELDAVFEEIARAVRGVEKRKHLP